MHLNTACISSLFSYGPGHFTIRSQFVCSSLCLGDFIGFQPPVPAGSNKIVVILPSPKPFLISSIIAMFAHTV